MTQTPTAESGDRSGEEPARAVRRRPVRAARDLRRRRGAAALARHLPRRRPDLGDRRRRARSCRPRSAATRCSISRSRARSVRRPMTQAQIDQRSSRFAPYFVYIAPVVPAGRPRRSAALHHRRHRVRGVQRDARRRRDVQAGVRRSSRTPASCSRRCRCSRRRSPTRASRCRARPTSASSCRFSTRLVRRAAARVDRSDLHLVDASASRSGSASSTASAPGRSRPPCSPSTWRSG